MSAFSDWNGPGCCGNGNSLPQVQTLEQLISRIGDLTAYITQLRNAFELHAADNAGAVHAIIQHANTAANAVKLAIDAVIGTPWSGTIKDNMDAVNARALTIEQSVGATFTPVNSVQTAIANIWAGLGSAYNNVNTVAMAIAALQARDIGLASDIAVVAADLQSYINLLQSDTATLNVSINTIRDIRTGKIRLDTLIDYNKWSLSALPIRPITNEVGGNAVVILGYLSPEWFADFANQPKPEQHRKSARAWLKFANTRPWNAIVDMTVNFPLNGTNINGSLTALASKTTNRQEYGNPNKYPPLRFGLYKGTSRDSGKILIYLGVIVEETYGFTYDSSFAGTGPIQCYVAGINFIAMGDAMLDNPNGGVSKIAEVDVTKDGQFSVTNLNAQTINVNQLVTGDGDNIWNVVDGELFLGNLNDHLELLSKDRPTVQHSDLSEHEIAYLTDLSQSIFWQRAVDVIVEDSTQLNTTMVTTDGAGAIETWDPASVNNVPGMYLSDKTGPEPLGLIFKDGDTALVKNSGVISAPIPDGKLNDVLNDPSNPGLIYRWDQLTGLNKENVVLGPPGTGTTFRDANDPAMYGCISMDYGNGTFQAVVITTTDMSTYSLPTYATYDLATTTWTLNPTPLQVPVTFDGYVHDITYEWSGPHLMAADYFIEAYALWTAHHDSTTMNYGSPAWAYTDFNMTAYRTADLQDVIDAAITGLATVQPDYAEQRSTIPYAPPTGGAIGTVANPAHILNRPWVGTAILEGGSFITPELYEGWIVDGGDFTSFNTPAIPGQGSPVPSSQQFRNVVMRQLYGTYATLPETNQPPGNGVWINYSNTLRWITDIGEMWFNALGTTMERLIPISRYYSEPGSDEVLIAQAYEMFIPTTDNALTFEIWQTRFDLAVPTNPPLQVNYNKTLYPDSFTDPVTSVVYETLLFSNRADGFDITSPRITRLEGMMGTPAGPGGSPPATGIELLLEDYEARIAALETALAAAQSTISSLNTTVGTLGTTVSGLSSTVSGWGPNMTTLNTILTAGQQTSLPAYYSALYRDNATGTNYLWYGV
jgi:hypothetical protein